MKLHIPKMSDSMIMERLVAVAKELDENWVINFHFGHGPHATISGDSSVAKPWESSPLAKKLHSSSGFSAQTIHLQLRGTTALQVQRRADTFDDLEVYTSERYGNNDAAQDFYISVVDAVCKKLVAIRRSDPPLRYDSELSQTLAARDAGLMRLEELLGRFTGDLASYREEITKDQRKAETDLGERLKEERAVIQKEAAESAAKLDARESALEKRIAELDDRSSTHVRREIRTKIVSELNNRNTKFKLSDDTSKKRIPVAVVLTLAGVIFLTLAVYWTYQAALILGAKAEWSAPLTYIAVKQFLATIAFAGVVWYAIKWSNNWFAEHAREEFRGKAMLLDIERASWIVESALEWRKADGKEMPSELLDGLTRGLFQYKDQPTSHSTAQDLTSTLLGASSKVKMRVGEAEIELDRKGAEKLRAALAEAD